MRIVFMGNPAFAIPTLKTILTSTHELAAVVSNPPKPMGRGQRLRHTAVGSYAVEHDLSVIPVEDTNSDSFITELKALNPDIFVVVAYKILPDPVIKIPPYGAINLHASLLPRYRGAAPIQWALMNGEPVTGVSIFQIASKVDTGAILKQKEIPILADDNYLSLSTRLCETGAGMIIHTLNELESGTMVSKTQDSSRASRAPKISKKMNVIDWSWPADKIHNWVRGLAPHPGMITEINSRQLRIYKTSIWKDSVKFRPGTVMFKSKNELRVSTGDGALALIEIQLEGKKRMPVEHFLLGFPIEEGDVLG